MRLIRCGVYWRRVASGPAWWEDGYAHGKAGHDGGVGGVGAGSWVHRMHVGRRVRASEGVAEGRVWDGERRGEVAGMMVILRMVVGRVHGKGRHSIVWALVEWVLEVWEGPLVLGRVFW